MSEERARARIASWLEPIAAGPTPAGDDARYDPGHELIRAEAAKLEAPAGGPPNWALIVKEGEKLTTNKSKDLLIEAYVAGALWEGEGLLGLAAGLFLLAESMDRFWEHMFPPVKRLRARVNAIDWLMERTNLTLGETPVGAGDHDAVAALEAGAKRLREVVSARFEDQAPAIRPLIETIERMKLN
ncbi:MAG: type VI secretion system ImpA family N-terminal domain-containing protein, partial [Sandaracinaceae bacterium]|nr:type VI secretion system ImpA family N-terminal domain-containing protein [Sandaracinaceae bacterium]